MRRAAILSMVRTLDIAVLVLGLSVVAAVSYAAYWRPHRGAGMASVRTSTDVVRFFTARDNLDRRELAPLAG